MSLKQKLVKEAMDIYEGKSFDSNAQDLSTTLSGSSEGHITAAAKPKKEPPATVTPKDPKPKTPPPKPVDKGNPNGVSDSKIKADNKIGNRLNGSDAKTGTGKRDAPDPDVRGKTSVGGKLMHAGIQYGISKLVEGIPFIGESIADKFMAGSKKSYDEAKSAKKAQDYISSLPEVKQNKDQFIKDTLNANMILEANKKQAGQLGTVIDDSGLATANIPNNAGQSIQDKTNNVLGGGPRRRGSKKAPAIPKTKTFDEMVGGSVRGAINSLTPKPPPPKVPFKAGDGVRKNPVKPTPKTKMDLGDNGLAPKTTPKKEAPKGTTPPRFTSHATTKQPTTPSFLAKPAVPATATKSAMGFTIPKVTPAAAATSVKTTPKGTTPPRFTSPATPKTTPKKEAPKPTDKQKADKQKENKSRLDKMKADKKTTPKKEVPKTTPKPAPKPAPKPTAKQLSNKARLDKMKADKKTTPKKEAPKPKPKPTAKQVSNKDRLNKMKANKKTTPKKTTPKKQSLGGKIKNFFRRKK
jgi:hypothetical protein